MKDAGFFVALLHHPECLVSFLKDGSCSITNAEVGATGPALKVVEGARKKDWPVPFK
jgi:hypothetical protein